jgi:transglutaminase-like putative cysteine protease
VLFTADVDAAWRANPVAWSLAGLDAFDGQDWTVSNEFRIAGTAIAPSFGLPGAQSTAALHIDALEGPWIPTFGVVTGLSPASLRVNSASGAVLDAQTLRAGAYSVTAILPTLGLDALRNASIASGTASLTSVPGCFPEELRASASSAAMARALPSQQALAVEDVLARSGSFTIDPDLAASRSCGSLQAFAAQRVGTPTQFAQAYVLMARSVGLPARLMTGFRPGTLDTDRGTTTVHLSDFTVWPEVQFNEVGWVAFDPTPRDSTAPAATPAAKAVEELRQADPQRPSNPELPTDDAPLPSTSTSRNVWPVVVAAVVGAVLIVFLIARIAPRRLRRWKRRRHDDANERALGAWHELLDRLMKRNLASSSMTPSEVTARVATASLTAAASVERLGRIADSATYASSPISEAEADEAWRSVTVALRALPRRPRSLDASR